ncbi:phosphate propanoyltransferase [Lysinibacillus antri]|uniref:Phosphate propanoyltransferase n=1 Tax=Lysinibacillus antri TaxID=2498145 RepID=A0A3S0QRK0_9BACI|nr:phosphate propanoyltransferase [Lysinibacillus antri]RUL55882.1 phosphate propanoyltransferase [Lysinibacillus antri]
MNICHYDDGNTEIPIAVSARHCHLSEKDFHRLFGEGCKLEKWKDLSQPGQYATHQLITIKGLNGKIENVRVLGPFRNETQIEISQTDSIKLGVSPPIRLSGELEDSAPITLIGPTGVLHKRQGLIIAQAHIHMSFEDAHRFQVSDGDVVGVEVVTCRPIHFLNVVVRVSENFVLEMHIDTDEANAASVASNIKGKLLKLV